MPLRSLSTSRIPYEVMQQMSQLKFMWSDDLGVLLKMGIPMGATQLIQFSRPLVDTLMVGRLGTDALAAASMGGSIWFVMFLFGLGPAAAVSPLVSQALGANPNNILDVRLSVRMALWTVACGFPIALAVFLCAEQIVIGLGQPDHLAAMVAPFVLALALVWPFALGNIILRSFLAALGKTQVPLWIVTFGAILNALLNYALIYGNWGAPRLELVGAGIASIVAEAIAFAALIVYIRWDNKANRFHLFADFFAIHLGRLKEILRLGWPIGVDIALWNLFSIASLFLMGLIGTEEMAAYNVARNSVAAFVVMFPLGLTAAGGVLVGTAAGAGNQESVRRISVLTVCTGVVTVLFLAIPCIVFPETIGTFYLNPDDNQNQGTLHLIAAFLPIVGIFVLLDAAQFTSAICLRALKDVRMPMILAGISYWVIGFPTSILLGFHTSMGAMGVWCGLLVGLLTASLLLGRRLSLMTRRMPMGQPDIEYAV